MQVSSIKSSSLTNISMNTPFYNKDLAAIDKNLKGSCGKIDYVIDIK